MLHVRGLAQPRRVRCTPCRSCGAPVVFVLSEHARRFPLDPDPVPDGNLRLEPGAGILIAYVAVPRRAPARAGQLPLDLNDTAPPPPAGPLYVSHFVTCPNAAEHRRPR